MKDAANVEVNGTSETKQVEEEKSVEPVLDPKETSTEAVEDPEVSEIIADQTMEDSESEAEEELDIDLTKEIEIDLQKLDNLSQELLDITEHYNVEKLEIAMARLMDVIWRDRNQWDKSATLDNLKNTIDSIKATL